MILNFSEEVVQFGNIDERAERAEVEDEVSVGDWKTLKAGQRNVIMGLGLGVGCGIHWF